MTTTHNGFVLRQLILENRICELRVDIEEATDVFAGKLLKAKFKKASLEAEAGRTRLKDDELDTVFDMLQAMGDSAMEEAKQHRAMADKKRSRMTVVETPPDDAT